MITRIELTNFMSHAHTVIEPAAGLTVLVGPNNCGKSAVVAALQILCHNDNSTYVLRHGERECSVKVETDDSHVVEWKRKNSPSYIIDGQPFDRLGRGGPPAELHAALRLAKVDGEDGTDFDVHFGTQKSPIFLLGSSAAHAARFFASSSDAIRLVQMQKRHKERLAERQREKVRLEAESKKLNAELAILQDVPAVERELKDVEHRYDELQRLSHEIDAAQRDARALRELDASVSECRQRAAALSPLAAPPQFHDTAALASLAKQLAAQQRRAADGESIAQSLSPLASPPVLADAPSLAQLIGQLQATRVSAANCRARAAELADLPTAPELADERALQAGIQLLSAARDQVAQRRSTAAATESLQEPPGQHDLSPLAAILHEFRAAGDRVAFCQTALAAAGQQLEAAATALRELAETALCPTCGAPFDADRLLAAAAAGGGGHDHG
jgi:exonuclease SbcC